MSHPFEDALDSRLADIAIARTCVTRSKTNIEKEYLLRSAILTIYASLEGGIKDLTGILFKAINARKHNITEYKACYALLALSDTLKLDQEIKDYDKQIKTTAETIKAVLGKGLLSKSIVECNLSPKVMKKLCSSLDLHSVISTPNEASLNSLLQSRNAIAHGDRGKDVSMALINELSGVVTEILYTFGSAISEAYEKEIWLIPKVS